jgi:hypothetical protein
MVSFSRQGGGGAQTLLALQTRPEQQVFSMEAAPVTYLHTPLSLTQVGCSSHFHVCGLQ